MVKKQTNKQKIRLPIHETWVQSLGQEDPLEKETAAAAAAAAAKSLQSCPTLLWPAKLIL